MLYASLVETGHRALATPDIIIIGFYFALVFGIGMYFARRERTSEDYFLAGRNVGWFFIGASLFVSNISTEHFIGLSGTGASSGLAVGHFEWLACLILLILGWVFVPFYLRSNVFTMPEFLERVAGWKLWETAVVLVMATGIYTVAGGLAAVIYTDTVQTLILITGAVALTVIGLIRVGGLAHLRTMVPPDYFHMIKPASDASFPWTGIFFGAPILGIWYWCTDQVIVQRVLSARDEGHAKAGTIFAGFLKILPVFMLVLPGIIAFALFPEQVKKPDFAYPTLVLNLLPVGLVGLVMAALLAAVMGAMSSVFNSASTLATLDFYKKIRPQASESQLVYFGRVATGVMVLLGLLWVPFIHYISSQLYIYLQSVQAYISPPISACFILGILWPRLNGSGAITSLLTGFVMGATRFILELADRAMFVVCSVVLVAVSLMTPSPERKKLAGLTFATVDDKIETVTVGGPPMRKPAYETPAEHAINIVFSLLLLGTVVGLWIYFR
ncbi:MAG: sodium transporter [Acidobacteria bacterium]|nr:MAG: sodium transporter [Acidobacteriota bacterium]